MAPSRQSISAPSASGSARFAGAINSLPGKTLEEPVLPSLMLVKAAEIAGALRDGAVRDDALRAGALRAGALRDDA